MASGCNCVVAMRRDVGFGPRSTSAKGSTNKITTKSRRGSYYLGGFDVYLIRRSLELLTFGRAANIGFHHVEQSDYSHCSCGRRLIDSAKTKRLV